jgi:thioredoxin 1
MLVINADNFDAEVTQSGQAVVVDLWGPKCGPCLALMPEVEALAGEYAGKIKFGKLNVMENRRLAISLKVMGVPTFLFYKGGEQRERITGDSVTIEAIRAGAERLLS